MKIFQVTASYKPAYIYGGPIMSVARLCESLAQNSTNELEVFTTTANGKEELKVAANESAIVDGVKVTYFNRLTKDHTHFSPSLLRNLRRKIKVATNKELIIHIHAWWNTVSILSCWIAKSYNIPVVLSPRGMLTNYSLNNRNSFSKRLIHKLIGKRLLEYCHIHATSEKEKNDVLEIIQPKGIEVIYNQVNLPNTPVSLTDLLVEPLPIFKLIFLSRIEEKKGLELLFKALSDLSINWTLTIAGSGETAYIEYLKAESVRLNIDKKIVWAGQISNDEKFKLLAAHDLMVLTSYNENFANVVVESLSVGTPVLVSEQVGLANYVRDNDLGWITTLHTDNIKQQITEACNAQSKRLEIKLKAPALVNTDFDSAVLVEKYLDLYNRIVK
ncbi:XrtY-associated glycosyltransferase XYAG1 [Pedobacter punctiformis]|uniref:Glycosyltransferase n=1 Tax=Pedobacter punctiformis TaxID=3004097 RepID=A0ABT4L9W1_9SPHI|nr:glycosyltransferase [Pedobacter sp. HCMS5-2]MCZ4244710.1 glycosyltransferase [Pedobacter sp. HCMS5-2]